MTADLLSVLILTGVAAPATALLMLGAIALLRRPLGERVTAIITGTAMAVAAAVFGLSTVVFAGGGAQPITLSPTGWMAAAGADFAIDVLIDGKSLVFATVTSVICVIVSAFSHRYLHREVGHHRYFVLFNVFALGLLLIILAGSMEVLFAGWELLGISSTLLVGYFHERPAPVRNALRVFIVYRVSDAAMLSAAVLAHHLVGPHNQGLLFGGANLDPGVTLTGLQATAIGGLLSLAAAGKCAQLPFTGWMSRAMEGPTPSTAVFYGALSIHAGAFLLLRASPLLEQSLTIRVMVGAMGLATAVFATVVGRTQTDIKSALAFASATQVSIILIEIALGLQWLALLHMAGHVLLRLFQYLRAPSALRDFLEVRSAVGGELARTGTHLERLFPEGWRAWLYRFALERGYLDAGLERLVVAPYLAVAHGLEQVERRWCAWIAGESLAVVVKRQEESNA